MIGPLARLIDQAELGLADLTQRAITSVTVPLRAKGQELATETIDTLLGVLKTVAIKAILCLVATIMLVVAIVYAVAALYQELLPILGPVGTRLTMAGVFLVIAIVAIVLLVLWPKSTPSPATLAIKADKAAAAASKDAARAVKDVRAATVKADVAAQRQAAQRQAAERQAEERQAEAVAAAADMQPPPVDLAGGFESVVTALGDAGFRREQAGLRAGLALASQLKPMQIVSLALIGGFIAATRYPKRR